MNFPDFKSKHNPCKEAVEYIEQLPTKDCVEIIKILIEKEKYQWAEWGLARLLPTKDAVEWACICAESVLPIFESKYADDMRPRKAIEAARSGLDVGEAAAAAWAWAAAGWAWAASSAVEAAEEAADAAALAAKEAAWAAEEAADSDMRLRNLLEGMLLMGVEK